MKFSTTEEYGLRCLIQLAQNESEEGLTIPEISEREGISEHQAAKILRLLRLTGFIASTRGKKGGYTLSRPASEIPVSKVLEALGGRLYDQEFCIKYSGDGQLCSHFSDCTVRNLWISAQLLMDTMMENISLEQIMNYPFMRNFTQELKGKLGDEDQNKAAN